MLQGGQVPNTDILEKFLEDWGYGNSILITGKARCYICDREFRPKEDTGGILVDNFFSVPSSRLKFLCSHCWWKDDLPLSEPRFAIVDYLLSRKADYAQKRAKEEEERKNRKRPTFIFHAERKARSWVAEKLRQQRKTAANA